MNIHNKILLFNRNSIYVNPSDYSLDQIFIKAFLLDMAQLGYTLDKPLIDIISTFSIAEFAEFHKSFMENLRKKVGAHVKYVPLYTDFPNSIPKFTKKSENIIAEKLANVFNTAKNDINILSCGHITVAEVDGCPICLNDLKSSDRPPLEDTMPVKIITLADQTDIYTYFSNLISANSSISETNKQEIVDLISNENMSEYIPSVIPMKENLALVAALMIKHDYDVKDICDMFKTATDVLRLATQLSDGDVSLATKTKFKLTNSQRNKIMSLLDNINDPCPDMIRHKMSWLRLGEYLHVGAKKNRFPNVFSAFDTLRNDANTIVTFNSKVEKLMLSAKVNVSIANELATLLSTRPGEFARRLDYLYRYANCDHVNTLFAITAEKLTTTMLVSLKSYFNGRTEKSPFRHFTPKGSIAKMQIVDDTRMPLTENIVGHVNDIINSTLVTRFSKLPSLGNVYIDPVLGNYLLPTSQRSASESMVVTVTRGSRIDVPDTKAVRMFLWWKNNDYRIDVDLSAVCYSEDWKFQNELTYYNTSSVNGTHSGDITDAPHGAAEFIDIDITAAKANGIRYVVMIVNSFSGEPFNNFDCHAGVMARDKVDSGQIFEPTTVTQRFDITSESRYCVPIIFDLEEMQYIWADYAVTASAGSNARSERGHTTKLSQIAVNLNKSKPNVYDLLKLHCDARATSVDFDFDPDKEYDLILDEMKASDLDDLLSNWMK